MHARAATVSLNQQMSLVAIPRLPNLNPPAAESRDGKLRRLVRCADHYKALIPSNIVDAIGDGDSVRLTWIVTFQYGQRLPAVSSPWFFEIPYQFSLLSIHRNHWKSSLLKRPSLANQITHLLVALRVVLLVQSFAVGAQTVISFAQHSPNRVGPDAITASLKSPTEFSRCFPSPLQPGNGVARCGILQQFIQRCQELRVFFSTGSRPAPTWRMRPRSPARSTCWTSARPLRIVGRLRPVISRVRSTPPRPHCKANNPAKRRRFFSSSDSNTRLMARCSLAVALRGYARHTAQMH